MPAKRDGRIYRRTFNAARRNIHNQRIYRHACHTLGCVHSVADGLLCIIQFNNHTGFYAARTLMADA